MLKCRRHGFGPIHTSHRLNNSSGCVLRGRHVKAMPRISECSQGFSLEEALSSSLQKAGHNTHHWVSWTDMAKVLRADGNMRFSSSNANFQSQLQDRMLPSSLRLQFMSAVQPTSNLASPINTALQIHNAVPSKGSGIKTSPGWTTIHAHVQHSVRTRNLIPHGASILIAVSGGQDSLALAHILCGMARVWGWTLGIAHCDHRWRSDSAVNAEHVRALSETWQLPFHLCVAPSPPPSTEGSARAWRYGVLTDTAALHGYSHIATGHTASDRAETLLLNLMRGTGLDGMQALSWTRPIGGGSAPVSDDEGASESSHGVNTNGISSNNSSALNSSSSSSSGGSSSSSGSGSTSDGKGSDQDDPLSLQSPDVASKMNMPVIALVRPLLSISREDTGMLCDTAPLPIYLDSTNKDITLRRNRVRLELLPYLRTHFNSRLDQGLARTAETLVADVEYLEEQSQQLLLQARQAVQAELVVVRKRQTTERSGAASPLQSNVIQGSAVHRAVLSAAPLALQRRALRAWLMTGLGGQVKMDYVEAVRSLLTAPQGSRSDSFAGNITAVVRNGSLVLEGPSKRHVVVGPARLDISDTETPSAAL